MAEKQIQRATTEKLLANLVAVINQDKDGSYFICEEAADVIKAAVKHVNTPAKRNPSLLELLELGCKVEFPTESGIYLKGLPDEKYIEIGTEYGKDGLWILSPDGLVDALNDADKMADA